MKHVSHYNQSPGRDLNTGRSKYKARMLVTQTRCPVLLNHLSRLTINTNQDKEAYIQKGKNMCAGDILTPN